MEEENQKRKTRGRKAKSEDVIPEEKIFYLRSNTGMHIRIGHYVIGVDEHTEIRENDLKSSFFLKKIERMIEDESLENLSE